MKKLIGNLIFISYVINPILPESSVDKKIGYDLINIVDQNFLNKAIAFFSENKLKEIEKQVNFKVGFSNKILKENAFSFYLKYWEYKKNQYKNDPYNYPKAVETIQKLKNNIYLVYMSEYYSIMRIPTNNGDELDSISNTDEIWIFKDNTWRPFLEYQNKFHKSYIIDLNNDGINDVILSGAYSDSKMYNVFVSNKSNGLNYIQDIYIIGDTEEKFTGNCNSQILVKYYENPKISKKAYFNCNTNKFVLK